MKRGTLWQYTSWHRRERSERPRSYVIATTPWGFDGCVWETWTLLDKWKEQLLHDDAKQPPTQLPTEPLSRLLSVLPLPLLSLYFMYFAWGRKLLPLWDNWYHRPPQLNNGFPSQIIINTPSYPPQGTILLVYFTRKGIVLEEWAWTRFIPNASRDVKVQIISVVKLSDTICTHLTSFLLCPLSIKIIRKFHKWKLS